MSLDGLKAAAFRRLIHELSGKTKAEFEGADGGTVTDRDGPGDVLTVGHIDDIVVQTSNRTIRDLKNEFR